MAWNWDEKTELAAALIVAGNLSLDAIAERCGVTRRTLAKWRKEPRFKARVERELSRFRAEVRRLGIGTVERRVSVLNDIHTRLRQVIEARADDPRFAGVPGGSTGLMTLVAVKQVGMGPDAQLISVFGLDVGLIREVREIQRQAAQELGQWQEKSDGGSADIAAAVALTGRAGRDFDRRQQQIEAGEIGEDDDPGGGGAG